MKEATEVIAKPTAGAATHNGNRAIAPTARTRVKRLPKRASYDREVINELLAYELFRIPDGVEYLAHSKRRGSVLADEAKAILQLRRNRVFQPEKMIRFQLLAQARRLDGREPVVNIVQQVQLIAQGIAQRLKELGYMPQVLFRGP